MQWEAQYHESPYRLFGSRLMKALIDQALELMGAKSRPQWRGIEITPSGAWKPDVKVPHDEIFFWNVTRYWADYLVFAGDALSPWAFQWMSYGLCKVPEVRGHYLSWALYDEVFTAWIRRQYWDYWHTEWERYVMTKEQTYLFWSTLWSVFERQQGQTSPSVRNVVDPIIQEFVKEGPQDDAVLKTVNTRLKRLAEATGVPWESYPAWVIAMPDLWDQPGDETAWELPLHVLSNVTNHGFHVEDIERFLENDSVWQSLVDMVQRAREVQPHFEFWFPIVEPELSDTGSLALTESVTILSLSSEDANRLNRHSGIGPVPLAHQNELYVRCRVKEADISVAYERAQALAESELALLRVAVGQYRWEIARYYYWTRLDLPKDIIESDGSLPMMSEWRDGYRLRGSVSFEYLTNVKAWADSGRDESRKLGQALWRAIRWQGLAKSQADPATAFFCWWMALEQLGNGSYEYKTVIPKVLAWVWHTEMWGILPPNRRLQGFYQDVDRLTELMRDLADIRNKAVVHGSTSAK
ncbi:MAG: hypothetical protein C7B47_14380 [Sulfobacillus thermosulfidooxidans]|uniref:Uncharacterized protein n=1 Tax=Sulfobacillus thermosulfidooxidans TaxID=28034 RepID=A0A2T2WQU7_SULTH|nr:MAG: hypothetical protein C7B47_14380 [Sulfobacillus thermosulfidooxidans]